VLYTACWLRVRCASLLVPGSAGGYRCRSNYSLHCCCRFPSNGERKWCLLPTSLLFQSSLLLAFCLVASLSGVLYPCIGAINGCTRHLVSLSVPCLFTRYRKAIETSNLLNTQRKTRRVDLTGTLTVLMTGWRSSANSERSCCVELYGFIIIIIIIM